MNKSYINEQELQSFYRDFNNKALDLLGEYITMEYALNDGASYIEGDTQSAVTDASEKVAKTKKRIEDILFRYNECMSDSIESMAGLDAGAVSKMKGELANLSEGAKKDQDQVVDLQEVDQMVDLLEVETKLVEDQMVEMDLEVMAIIKLIQIIMKQRTLINQVMKIEKNTGMKIQIQNPMVI